MTVCTRSGFLGVVVLAGAMAASSPRVEAFPAVWPSAAPETEGLSTANLGRFWKDMRKRNTTALLVIRNDRVVFEGYAPGYGRTTRHYTASLAKSLVGGMSLMLAMDEGRIRADDRASKYVPQWADLPLKRDITVRELATHTSGMSDSDHDIQIPVQKLTGWMGDFWNFYKGYRPGRDPFTLSRDFVPLIDRPGRAFHYTNCGMAMLSYCITASLRGAPQTDLRSLLRERLMRPIGVPDNEWSVGYDTTVPVDGLPLVACWGGAAYSPNATARIGRLLLRRGDWDGRQLISPATIAAATVQAGEPGTWGLGWWTNHHRDGSIVYPGLPADAFYGAGAGGQYLLVVPSLKLIVVRYGGPMNAEDDGGWLFLDVGRYITRPLLGVRPAPPYPPSPVIASVHWAPADTIVRRAHDSDCWPIAWGADNALYTAYGDGEGFEPFLPVKLSLGFARVTGGPTDFVGTNIRSPSGEQVGDGASGRKASGMTMIGGVLYMWVRNAGVSQLAWSLDRARTWNWTDWSTWSWQDWKFLDHFGCPSFLSFGRDYAGARDDFVYIYSPDIGDAYTNADQLILARAPKDRLLDRAAYAFYAGRGKGGQPVWTKDISQREGVFVDPGACMRCHVTYDPGIGRYLLVMPRGEGDTRFHGGLAIYDAPEPWGPWTTVYFTDKW
ncbi:MAG: serine hydrolase, partial [Opitutaceae bacterium]